MSEEDLYTYRGHCTHVVDGDTYDLLVDLGFGVSKQLRVRLLGIDTPEKYGRATKAEKVHGQEATDFAEDTALADDFGLARDLIIKTHKDKTGKYGRYLADISITETGEDLATLLRENGFEKRDDYPEDEV